MAIPTPIIRNLEQDGILRTMAIDLSENPEDRAAVIEVLRSKLYSDKILAPIREYATNAADSHVEAGCPDTPIQVILPTQLDPEFHIRDFGIGLTPDEVEKIYIKYGRSTKRNTNAQTGQLGLGCKSAFAYGDNFVVISYKDGVKTTYNLTINGVCTVICAEPMTSEDKNGIEVIVPVKQSDIREFQNKAIEFFKYWKVCPEIKGGDINRLEQLREELSKKPLFSENDWEIRPISGYSYGRTEGVAVMGNVPYPINWSILSSKLNLQSNDKDEVLYNFICSNKTILRFGIGELDFSASRESLEYTEKTCKVIVAKVRMILDSIFKILDSKIQSAASYWDALFIYNQIFGRDNEKLFQGDVYRLEKYYQGKFAWKGIKIESGAFEHLECWDQELGYSAEGKWKTSSGEYINGNNPVLTTYTIVHGRIKQNRPNEYSYNRITAGKNTTILIHDLDKPILTKSSVRWIFNEMLAKPVQDRPNKIYFLRFKDNAQMKDFFNKMHFESAPVIYVSSIINKVKDWLKQSRVSNGSGSSIVRDPQSIRCFSPKNRKNRYGYFDDTVFDRQEIDIHEEEGYYVELENGYIKINGRSISNLSSLSHYTNVLLEDIGEKIDYVYVLPERNRNAKWFSKAVEKGQWTKLEDYLKEKEDIILRGKGAQIAKAAAYYKYCRDDHRLGILFATKILPLITDKNGPMYKAVSEISFDFKKMYDLIEAMKFFGMDNDFSKFCSVDFEKLFKEVKNSYPLLTMLVNSSYIFSNEGSCESFITDTYVSKIAEYINLVDSNRVKPKEKDQRKS